MEVIRNTPIGIYLNIKKVRQDGKLELSLRKEAYNEI